MKWFVIFGAIVALLGAVLTFAPSTAVPAQMHPAGMCLGILGIGVIIASVYYQRHPA